MQTVYTDGQYLTNYVQINLNGNKIFLHSMESLLKIMMIRGI